MSSGNGRNMSKQCHIDDVTHDVSKLFCRINRTNQERNIDKGRQSIFESLCVLNMLQHVAPEIEPPFLHSESSIVLSWAGHDPERGTCDAGPRAECRAEQLAHAAFWQTLTNFDNTIQIDTVYHTVYHFVHHVYNVIQSSGCHEGVEEDDRGPMRATRAFLRLPFPYISYIRIIRYILISNSDICAAVAKCQRSGPFFLFLYSLPSTIGLFFLLPCSASKTTTFLLFLSAAISLRHFTCKTFWYSDSWVLLSKHVYSDILAWDFRLR